MTDDIGKDYYSIGEVCDKTGLKSHVLRYWETVFPQLNPPKNDAGRRIYGKEDIELILHIKELLHEKRYTIEGAKLELSGGGNETPAVVDRPSNDDKCKKLIRELKAEVEEILKLLG